MTLTVGQLSLFDLTVVGGQTFGRNSSGVFLVEDFQDGDKVKDLVVIREATPDETLAFFAAIGLVTLG